MTRCRTTRRVVKLGGSLLQLPGLIPRLRRWLTRQGPGQMLIVVGGGERVQQLRDRPQPLDDETAHWSAIDAMAANAAELAEALAFARCVGRRSDIVPNLQETQECPCVLVVDPRALLTELHQYAGRRSALPVGWHVTSDSIAAYIASELSAGELVLLKSCLPPPELCLGPGRDANARCCTQSAEITTDDAPMTTWSASGYVDPYFPRAAHGIPVIRAVNLRDECAPERLWPVLGP